ncbi:MAG: rRNA pseudouridine synthase [Candidatus Hydrogenedens sp.]|jgi:23S rRNA pseudouridine2604 synthase|nr:rRNA pseudouridine synthase [Candidatus Hydrogenedens sp.]
MNSSRDTHQDGESMRIAKLMARRGMCSRREAEKLIAEGWVFLDGEKVETPATRVAVHSEITLDPKAKKWLNEAVTILFNKPVGIVSGQAEDGYTAAIEVLSRENHFRPRPDIPLLQPCHLQGLAPAGRLDIDSHGLLVLTQDGRIAKELIGQHSTIDKEYLVRVSGDITKRALRLLNHGLQLDRQALRPAKVKILEPGLLHFVLREGKKRQIRRMCALVGLEVTNLKRVRIGKVRLDALPYGQWRFLDRDESF